MAETLPALPVDLSEFAARAAEFARSSRSAATERAYRSDWADFSSWCERAGLSPLPASPATVGAYFSARAGVTKVATLNRRLAAITVRSFFQIAPLKHLTALRNGVLAVSPKAARRLHAIEGRTDRDRRSPATLPPCHSKQRSGELMADFEQQAASIYDFDQDETRRAAMTLLIAPRRKRCGQSVRSI